MTGFICPICGRTSQNSTDIAEGYCGNCHDWTGDKKMKGEDLPFKTTWEGGHALIIEFGDEEFYAKCQCQKQCPRILTPSQNWDIFGMWWERHVMHDVQRVPRRSN